MHKIAVVGMSGIFPGAMNLGQFKQNIMEKRESIVDIPDERWIVNPKNVISSNYRPDSACSKRAGLVAGFEFDPEGFLVDKALLLELDLLHKMVLDSGREALNQCFANQEIRKRAGVVLAAIALPTAKSSELAWQIIMQGKRGYTRNRAISHSDTNFIGNIADITNTDALTAKMVSFPAALLAQAMGLGGGSFTLDAACASSLYAIKIASEQLISGRVDMMVAGGVSCADSLYTQIGFTQLRALSPSGRCSPFDKNADGLVVGEGAGVVVLKRFEDAVSCGDHILGVICGAGWSNDIEGNLVAPASEGQIRAMQSAYASAGWLPCDVQYIECHGSATPVGDNIELKSMASVWQNAGLLSQDSGVFQHHAEDKNLAAYKNLGSKKFKQGCAIGSVKSMTGHLLTAAGIAGFIKTLIAINEKFLPPSLNFSEPTSDSPLHTTGFYVQTEPDEWKPMSLTQDKDKNKYSARRAGVSAFGFGGINAHILVEEFCKDNFSIYFSKSKTSEDAEKSSPNEFKKAVLTDSNILPEQSKYDQSQNSVKDIAIVGMEVITPSAMNLQSFKDVIFGGDIVSSEINYDENGLCKNGSYKDNIFNKSNGLWINNLITYPGEFHIPPNQIDDLLPQHLIMLKAAMGAIKDAGISPRPEKRELRTDFGAAIGIEFDYGATNFHIRWRIKEEESKNQGISYDKSGNGKEKLDNNYPPLTSERTLGALGGIVASRVAREFKLGGPCFTVSAGALSGIKALEIGVECLRRGETKIFVCGSVDMAGDVRQDTLNRTLRDYSSSYEESAPFDSNTKGVFPSEGAAAIVIKTLEQAQKDGDKIYAVIKGTASASGGLDERFDFNADETLKVQSVIESYSNSLSNALDYAGVSIADIGLYQAHGSGDPVEDNIESEVFNKLINREFDFLNDNNSLKTERKNPTPLSCAIGSSSSIIGDTHAVSGLISIIQSALAIYHQIIPPILKFESPTVKSPAVESQTGQSQTVEIPASNLSYVDLSKTPFYFPKFPAFWIKESSQNRRIAVAASISSIEGTASHVVLEELKISEEFKIPSDCSSNKQSDYLAKKKYDYLSKSKYDYFIKSESKYLTEFQSQIADKLKYLKQAGKIAFLYPGSGNHFVGMGRKIGVMFADILRDMDESGASLSKRMLPNIYYPKRLFWEDGWQDEAAKDINSHSHNMIFGQVSFGVLMTRAAEKFGLKPDACIGHSLGETAGLFSLRVWNDPEDMLRRMEASDLFTKKLAGECIAARKAWKLQDDEKADWRVAAVNRSRDFVESVIKSGAAYESGKYDRLYLLIVNAPDECVIGGISEQVEEFIKETGCGAMYLDGVVTVHCSVAKEYEDEYRDLHRFECNPPEDIDFYSCFSGRKYTPETEATAGSIVNQALYGFDYTELINNAWNDGVRVFIEMGPGSSCTRAVGKILGDKEHLAVSLSSSSKDEDEEISLIRAFNTLADYAEALKSRESKSYLTESSLNLQEELNEIVSDIPHIPEMPNIFNDAAQSAQITADAHTKFLEFSQNTMIELEKQFACLTNIASNIVNIPSNYDPIKQRVQYAAPLPEENFTQSAKPLLDRDMCMEFAVGSAGKVLGEAFNVIDAYPVRVRLPDEPLMLVDRIMDIQGEMLSLKSGKIITQHDVKEGAWYLDGGKAPVSISIEAGQADLFLCSWLGIDHVVKGKRRYRLLDAKVTFHRTLPEPGETIEYHIEIDRFLKQGEIYLFFFHYKGFIKSKKSGFAEYLISSEKSDLADNFSNADNTPELLISMRDGCAGFFTLDEVKNSGGIILKKEDTEIITKENRDKIKYYIEQTEETAFSPLAALHKESYSDAQVESLRHGELGACFGKDFEGILLGKNLRLPGSRIYQNGKINDNSRMHLIDRVLEFNPIGGRFGLGFISAEADIYPDDWFLVCHFVDDMVMPGTLMYECCAHALRIFTQRIGWISTRDEPFYDIIQGIESDLKCRGPVTTQTQKARYEIEIKEIGYKHIESNSIKQNIARTKNRAGQDNYEPYVIADAHMFSDDHRIVLYKNMGMRIVGLSRSEIELFWSGL